MKAEIVVNSSKAKYCSRCGQPIKVYLSDGCAICVTCGFAFAVIENSENTELVAAVCNHYKR